MSNQDHLNLYLVTFNCGREFINPEAFASHFFDALTLPKSQPSTGSFSSLSPSPPDIIVINLQEIAPIAYAFLGGSSVTPYLDRFQKAVDLAAKTKFVYGDSDGGEAVKYVCICVEVVGMTAIMLFVRSELVGHMSGLTTANVGVGVQRMGNKGAAGVRLRWRIAGASSIVTDGENAEGCGNVSLTFVSAHLAPMEGKLERRIQDYKDIVRGLVFFADGQAKLSSLESIRATKPTPDGEGHSDGEEDVPLLQSSQDDTHATTSQPQTGSGMYSSTTHLFFAGDLNYRTSNTPPAESGDDKARFPKPPPSSASASTPSHFSPDLSKDQLISVLDSRRSLHGLHEAPITFSPTYKYNFPEDNPDDLITEETFVANKSYSFASHRWPSWCDRILYSVPSSSSSSTSHPTIQKYTSLPLLRTSDHRPVALSILVPFSSAADSQLESHLPPTYTVDPDWRANRLAARRKEIAVGVGAWLALTWEGRVVVSTLVGLVVGVWALVGFSGGARGV